jgi:anti-anti-sigma factor
MNGLRITDERAGNHLVLTLAGELSVLSSFAFNQAVEQQALAAGNYKLILDVGGLTLIDSSGMGALARLLKQLQEYGGCIHLVNIRANLLEMLYIARLDREFTWHKSVRDAVDACAALAAGLVPDSERELSEVRAAPVEEAGPAGEAASASQPATPFDHELPAYEGCANYPTWYVLRWFRNNLELRQRAVALIATADSFEQATEQLAQLVVSHQLESVEQTSLAAGLYTFALHFVDWREVAGRLAGE